MPLASRTGSEVALYNLICHAAGEGWDVGVACRTKGELLDELPPSVPVFVHETSGTLRRGYAGLSRRLLGDADGFPTLVHAKFKPDIWYVNTVLQPWIVRQAETRGIPCVLHTHELEQMLSHNSESETISLATSPRLVIASSEAAREVFRTLGRRQRIEVCYATIDPAEMKYDATHSRTLRRSLEISDDTFVWAMAGGLEPNKNPARFVEIAGEMLRQRLDVHFIWIGGGENGYGVYVKNKTRELGIAGKVSFLGPRRGDYYEWLNAADGLVITSFKESFSLVAVEAAHFGKPIVSFDCGGVKEIIRDGMGVVIDSWNNADLTGAMAALMRGDIFFDPSLSTERVKEFNISVQGPRWINFMREHFAG